MQAELCLITFNPVALIFSASWSTATLLGAQTKTWQKNNIIKCNNQTNKYKC